MGRGRRAARIRRHRRCQQVKFDAFFWGAAIPVPISDLRRPRHVEAVKQIELELVAPVAGAVDLGLLCGINTVLGMVIGSGALVAPRGFGYRAYRRLVRY